MPHDGARGRLAESLDRLAWIALLALVVVSPFAAGVVIVARHVPGVPPVHTDFTAGPTDVALVATLACWAASLLLRPRAVILRPRFLWIPVGLVLLVAWIGVPFSIDPPLSAWQAARFSLIGALAAYVATEVRHPGRFVLPAAAMLAVQSVVVLGQAIGQEPLGLPWLGELPVRLDSASASVITAPDGSRLLRAYGLAAHPNILGGLLAFGLLVVGGGLAAAIAGRDRVDRNRPWGSGPVLGSVAVLGGVVVLGSAALVATFSRGAWLALVAGAVTAVALLWLARADVTGWIVVGAIAIGVLAGSAPLIGPYLAARTTATEPVATETRSIEERFALADAAVAVVAARPLLGSGLGTLAEAMPAVRPAFGYRYQPAHLVPLTAAAETGVIGVAAVVALGVVPWIGLWRTRGRWTRELAAATALLVGVGAVSLSEYYPWSFTAGRVWAGIAIGVWAGTYVAATRGEPDARETPDR